MPPSLYLINLSVLRIWPECAVVGAPHVLATHHEPSTLFGFSAEDVCRPHVCHRTLLATAT